MDMANELLDAIDILVNQTTNNKFTQIYSGICKSVVDSSTCVMTVNGKDNNVTFYGVRPKTGNIYRVFIPNGNMSMAFIVTIPTTYGEVGAAPAGFGLGESSTYDNLISDCNQATKNGWYWTYENVQNAPMDYGFLHVCCNGSYIKQEWWVAGTMGVLMAIRVCNSGTWMPWEWVNPLMQLGGMDADGNPINEYRTTERYLGKPVYVMVVDCGSVGANTWRQVSNIGKNVKDVVRFSAIGIEGNYGETVVLPSDGDGLQLRAFVNRTVINNIYVKFKCDQRSLSEVKFTLWYTKTTD